MSDPVTIVVQRACSGAAIPEDAEFEAWVTAALEASPAPAELTLRVVDEAEASVLNERFRGRGGPTNVLSFPAGIDPETAVRLQELGTPLPLGDIVICAPLVAREAAEQGKAVAAHWAHLVVHGVLHLRGFDHQRDDEARRMEGRERAILGRLGVDDPYREVC